MLTSWRVIAALPLVTGHVHALCNVVYEWLIMRVCAKVSGCKVALLPCAAFLVLVSTGAVTGTSKPRFHSGLKS
jgi:hypothetical protein